MKAKGLYPEEEKMQLSGTVLHVIYRNSQNDYAVLELMTDGEEQVIAVGQMPQVDEDDEVILYGKWTHHPEHGEQFSVEALEKRLPADVSSILRYLSSKNVKGVGPVTALKIVNRYGVDSFDVIEHHPEWLADIPGITKKKAAEINRSFCETVGMRNLMMFCREYMSGGAVSRIYKKFGASALGKIRENPYCLCRSVYGIGFEKSDAIAKDLGFDMTSPLRLISGMVYLLEYNAQMNGHTCMPEKKLIPAASELLQVSEEAVRRALLSDAASDELSLYRSENGETYVYTSFMAFSEKVIVERLQEIFRMAPAFSLDDATAMIEKIERERQIVFARLQRQAILDSLQSGVMILTGGPGTGKTTVIQGLMRIYSYLGLRVFLAAPTGRAAKRISESTGEEAKTVHRMLEMESGKEDTFQFQRNEKNPLDCKVVIVDEASMLDIPLFFALMRAMPRGGRLILIGDSDQLPPVGAGNVLEDLCSSGVFATVCLNEIFRQSEDSRIVVSAHEIREGNLPDLSVKDKDFFFLPRYYDEDIANTVVSLVSERLPHAYGQGIITDIQVLSPSRRGTSGTENLNRLLQAALNPASGKKKELRLRDRVFREGDRVMQIRNNYEIPWQKNGVEGTGIFNGDIGVLQAIRAEDEAVDVLFDDRLATYDYSVLEELEHAYAITVHKSQGSEYGIVIIPLYRCAPMLLTRNLIYTAVTRAKDKVVLVGRKDVLVDMIRNNRQDFRYSLLPEKLRKTFSAE